ncbi:type I-E CRISPR-associated protein Cse1/CasA [Saccharopolyspora sp. MS10]|uniref:type I-E CRISPR-associated protein Cse1/CasA n=1 Tax=Saccharopolyspora sp. MS10 TaxID=3385973 RepID=UPI00399FC94A
MPPSFDLAERGFCRVRWRPGRSPGNPDAPVGFRDLLVRAADIADVEVPHPPALAGLLRVLTVMAARIGGLDALDRRTDWEDARLAVLDKGKFDPGAVQQYFAQHEGRFELFHTASSTPFLQDPRLLDECRTVKGEATSSGVNKLGLGRAAGQSFVWLAHTVDEQPPPLAAADAVFALLAWLYFGVPGRCTPRRVGETAAADTKAGPLRGTVSYHPVGESLFETLVLGVPFVPSSEPDPALWEDEPRDPCALPPPGTGVGGLLANRFQHAVLLEPDEAGGSVVDARITWAWRLPRGPAQDPYLIYRTSKDGLPYPQPAEASRAAWRDLDCLIGKHEDHQRPVVFEGLDDLMSGQGRAVRIKALGFEQDRSQAKDKQFYSGTTPAKQELWQQVDPDRFGRLRSARMAAEVRGWHLRGALTEAWWELVRVRPSRAGKSRDGGVPWLHSSMSDYWERAEHHFWQAISTEQPPNFNIVNRFIHLALKSYDTATGMVRRTPEEIKIIERNRRRLWTGYQSGSETQNGAEND